MASSSMQPLVMVNYGHSEIATQNHVQNAYVTVNYGKEEKEVVVISDEEAAEPSGDQYEEVEEESMSECNSDKEWDRMIPQNRRKKPSRWKVARVVKDHENWKKWDMWKDGQWTDWNGWMGTPQWNQWNDWNVWKGCEMEKKDANLQVVIPTSKKNVMIDHQVLMPTPKTRAVKVVPTSKKNFIKLVV